MKLVQRIRVAFGNWVNKDTSRRSKHAGHSLARTIKDSSHVTGNKSSLGRSATGAQLKIVTKGHENYTKSFEK